MDFAETVLAIEQWSGQPTEAEVWGLDDGAPVAFLAGELRRMEHVELDTAHLLAEQAAALSESEVAETFFLGEANLSLWPSRFLSAGTMPNTRGWIEVVTKDAVVRIGPKSIPWVD